MDTSNRIDTQASFTLELRNRRQNATDDGTGDLFAQALGQQLAKHHDDAASRYSVGKTRSSSRSNVAASASTTASDPARDPQAADTTATTSDSRETISGKKPTPPAQNTSAKSTNTGTKAANPKAAASNAAATKQPAADGECATAADGTPAPAVTEEGEQPAAVVLDADAKAAVVTDVPTAAPATAPVQPEATPAPTPPPVSTAQTVPLVQASVLLLTGVTSPHESAAGDATTAAGTDPAALAQLLNKLNAAQAAAPKSAAGTAQQQADPNAIGQNTKPETIGPAKPSQPATTDRSENVAVKSKTKTGGQKAVITEQTDASPKPTTLQQGPLSALAQASANAGRGIVLPEGMGVNEEGEYGVTSDLEFSAWSEQLGPGFSGGLARGANFQQSAFLAQLKQNVALMQPHEQVAVQIQRAAQNGVGRLTVDLQPAELGRVEIKMTVDKDKNVTASVVVDRPATLDLLQRDARSLERILQDAGLQTDSGSLSFSLRNSGGDAQGQNQGGGSGRGNRGGTEGSDAAAAASAQARPGVVATADGYVDLET